MPIFMLLNLCMKKSSAFLLLYIVCSSCFASDSLVVNLNKQQFNPGDSVIFTANVPYKKPGSKSTLHVFIEDVRHQFSWKLRYPLLDGKAGAIIVLPKTIPDGQYAFTFSVQREFFHILGRVTNEGVNFKQLNCLIIPGKKEFFTQVVDLDGAGYFQIANWYFPNKTNIIFTPLLKKDKNTLNLEIETPLDSSFYAETQKTLVLTIGRIKNAADTNMKYSFDQGLIGIGKPLDNVVVLGKKKSQAEVYNEKNTTGLFSSNGNTQVFDNIETSDLTNSASVWEFLIGVSNGFSISRNSDVGGFQVLRRGYEPDCFINEMQCSIEDISNLNTSDIAILKIFNSPFMGSFMGSAGGAVAVYLKKGSEGGSSTQGRRHSFVVYGYTPDIYDLPIARDEFGTK